MDITQWYRSTAGDDSENQVAIKSGVVQRTLNRQLAGGQLSPATVVAIARAYGKDVLDALVTVGLITHDDIRAHGVRGALKRATAKELAHEVTDRLIRGEGHKVFDQPVGELYVLPDAADHPGRDADHEGGGV